MKINTKNKKEKHYRRSFPRTASKSYGFWKLLAVIALMVLPFLVPVLAHAQFGVGGGFEGKLRNLQDALIGTILPMVSTIGLVYAAILSISGSGEGRGKVVGVVFMSVVGFMARYIIEFFKNIAS